MDVLSDMVWPYCEGGVPGPLRVTAAPCVYGRCSYILDGRKRPLCSLESVAPGKSGGIRPFLQRAWHSFAHNDKSAAVTTPSFGIRGPDVVWMPCDKWEAFDRDDPVPF